MRRAAKIDANQNDIVEALRKEGATVQSLAAVGNGVPDLLIGFGGVTVLMEVKDGSKAPSGRLLTPLQMDWHSKWNGGTLCVVNDVESALRVLKVIA